MRPALIAAAALAAVSFCAAGAKAQFVYVTGYAPAPVVVAQPTVVYRPATPVVTYSPVVAAPVPVAPVVVGGPVVTTRYRPFLGGTVTRVRYGYTPAIVAY